jgi:hypothetical protein
LKVIFDYLSIYSDILPTVTFIFAFSKHRDKGLWVLFFFNLYSFSSNLLVVTGWQKALGFNGYVLYRLFTILGYSFIATFFYKNISLKIVKKSIIITYLILLLYAVYDYLASSKNSFDSGPSAIEAILIIGYSLFYLFEQIKNPRVFFIYTLDKFWVVSSLLIYYTGTFFLFIYAESYLVDPSFHESYFIINNSFLLLNNIVFSIVLFIKKKTEEYGSGNINGLENYLKKHY